MNSEERIAQIWNHLHSIPEPAFQENKTSAYLAQQLRQAGYTVEEHVGAKEFPMLGNVPNSPLYRLENPTGVIGTLDSGKPGPVVGLRSDMDCLMFPDGKGGQRGIHACGHDGHMAMVLAAAEQLAAEGISRGKVKIIFQPAEEIGMGALSMINAGCLDDLDYLFGMHLMSKEMAPKGRVIPCVKWTACTLISADIKGRGAHGSKPHLGINAIDVGASIVAAVNALHTDPLLSGNVKTTRFQAGGASLNSICESAQLGFDLRSTDNAEMEKLRTALDRVVVKTAQVYGAEAKTQIIGTCPASSFDETLLQIAQEAIVAELGQEGVLPPKATTVGEDFNFYAMLLPKVKTAFLGLGCDLEPGLHDSNMHFDRSALVTGSNIDCTLVKRALEL